MDERSHGAAPELDSAGLRAGPTGGNPTGGGPNGDGRAVEPWEVPIGSRPKAPPLVALVVGATGYVGRALVDELERREGLEHVIAHVRPDSPRREAAREWFGGRERVALSEAALETGALAEVLGSHGVTHVFLCHGTTARRARAEGIDDPYEAVDVGITRTACEAAAQLDVAPRIVHLSSVGAKATSRSAYLAARGRAEDVVRASGVPFTICRAPLLSGPDRDERRPGETFARRLLRPMLRIAGALGLRRLSARHLPMDAAEAAEGLARSGFHYMTIDRVVRSDELRRVGVYEREHWTPASRRDAGRH